MGELTSLIRPTARRGTSGNGTRLPSGNGHFVLAGPFVIRLIAQTAIEPGFTAIISSIVLHLHLLGAIVYWKKSDGQTQKVLACFGNTDGQHNSQRSHSLSRHRAESSRLNECNICWQLTGPLSPHLLAALPSD